MDPKRHAWLARSLIRACGGLDPSAAACRMKRSRLSQCQDPNAGAFLTADVIADLEGFCGDPLYSRALLEEHPSTAAAADLATLACETTEVAAKLQAELRTAKKRLGRRDRDQLLGDLDDLDAHQRALRDALTGGEA